MEVQGIRVEQTGEGGREAAVAKATGQAAAQVLEKLGHAGQLPTGLSPAQLDSISTYVDVASESVQPNYYAGTFNIGIRVRPLLRLAGVAGEDAVDATPPVPMSTGSTSSASPAEGPRWVLVVPARETTGSGVLLWNPSDPWEAAWQRLGNGGGITLAAVSGDAGDQATLPSALVQQVDAVALREPLAALARKYNAPAVALIRLHGERATIQVDDTLQLDVAYLEKGSPDVLTAQGALTVRAAMAADPVGSAVQEARRLLTQLATGAAADAGPPPVSSGPALGTPLAGTPGLSAASRTVYPAPAPAAGAENALWVRIPLAQPADLVTYRRRIDSIPGARFEITALNRLYVEGNIRYTGDRAALMRELAARGLGQGQPQTAP